MKRLGLSLLVCVGILIAVTGCSCAQQWNDTNMSQPGIALGRATAMAQGVLKNQPNMTGKEIIKAVERASPGILSPLHQFKLDAAVKDGKEKKWAVLLVCDPDGNEALLESVNCSAFNPEIGKHYKKPKTPCDFTLDVKSICN